MIPFENNSLFFIESMHPMVKIIVLNDETFWDKSFDPKYKVQKMI